MQVQEHYQRSFMDALTLGRNRRDDFTIYYYDSLTGKRAVYEITGLNEGAPYIDGRALTLVDTPADLRAECDGADHDCILVRYAPSAMKIFAYNGIALDTGWDIRPFNGQ